MTRKRDQTGANQFSWQHVASRHLERGVIIERHKVNQRLGVQVPNMRSISPVTIFPDLIV